jgi:succinate-acetate transporter protein
MKQQTNYFFLSGFFLVVWLVTTFFETFATPTWFKVFILILCVTFLIMGISNISKKGKQNNQE